VATRHEARSGDDGAGTPGQGGRPHRVPHVRPGGHGALLPGRARFPGGALDLRGGLGTRRHPDFIHFFFDIGNDDRIAFFYYFGADPAIAGAPGEKGDVYARFGADVPEFFVRSRHLAIHVDGEDELLEYRRRLDDSAWPVEMQIKHETIESIYTHDPNGYMVEFTRPMRPVTPQEDLDANITIDALLDVVEGPDPTFGKLLARKAELIVERAADWVEVGR
jgi:Glyoxalase/Bleomycin resistance protein/Dioxygenase superfamily